MFTKGYVPWNKKYYPEAMRQQCACGCGEMTSGKMDHGKVSQYIIGHFNKGKKILYKERPSMQGQIPWNKGKGLGLSEPEMSKIRHSREYQAWRGRILEASSRRCAKCNSDKEIHVHHIKPVFMYPELMLNLDNGIVLCKDCHKKVDHSRRYHESLKSYYRDNHYLLFGFLYQ